MDDRVERRPPSWIPWALTSVALIGVAIAAYSLGAHREAAAAGEGVARWHHHGWFPGFGILWLFFLLFCFRMFWWGGYPYRYRRPWRYGRYHPGWYEDERDEWEAWHRREHERMDKPGSRGATPTGSDKESMS